MVKHQFQTDRYQGVSQLERWQDELATAFGPFEVEPTALQPFQGRLSIKRIAGLQFNDLHYCGQKLVRTKANIARLDDEFYTFGLPLSGPLLVEQNGEKHQVGPGCVYLMNQSSAYQAIPVNKEGYRSLSISIPAVAFKPKVRSLGDFYQLTLDKRSPQAHLLADFIRNLFDGLATWQESQVAQLGDQLLELIMLFMMPSVSEKIGYIESDLTQIHLRRAKRYINQYFSIPSLEADQVATACNISVSYLHRIFNNAQLSVAGYVYSQRIFYSKLLLTDSQYAHLSLAEIAVASGFLQASHFSRRFKQQVGISPSDYRKQAHESS